MSQESPNPKTEREAAKAPNAKETKKPEPSGLYRHLLAQQTMDYKKKPPKVAKRDDKKLRCGRIWA